MVVDTNGVITHFAADKIAESLTVTKGGPKGLVLREKKLMGQMFIRLKQTHRQMLVAILQLSQRLGPSSTSGQ